MDRVLKLISLIPALVHWAEALFGKGKGSDKAAEVLNIAQTLVNEIPSDQITDKDGFNDGLKKINDGVVECLNASLWAKK